ncbi:MAG: DEAD/DEAH box helicase [Gemmatimonadaceae bacterium]|nr:DEAD/DEAH box helicase [Gemmatimonadaceae bacterium]
MSAPLLLDADAPTRPRLALRPYQRLAIDAAYQWHATNEGNCLLVVPTGGGKSLIMGTLAAEAVSGGARVCVIAHRKELIEQNWKALQHAGLKALDCGIISGQLGRKDRATPATVASIQTLARAPFNYGPFDLLLIDEAHLVPRSEDTAYRKVLEAFRTKNPNVRTIGLTATPYRLDSGRLDTGEGRVFHEVAYEISIQTLLDGGYLAPLISKATLTRYDVTGVAMRGGEYVAEALQSAVDDPATTAAIVEELARLGADRRRWLVFCVGVAHAEHMAEALTAAGFPAAAVHGGLSAHERSARLGALRNGTLRVLTNCDVLTTGYDEPSIDLLALCRPTASTGLHVQMLGRGFRTAPGKTDCIAEGQLILTDSGLVPIEQVTPQMRVWDGVEFVTHAGVIARGEQEVIEYAGLTATPDHRVWTTEGWKSLGQCAIEQVAIAVTGIGRTPVREVDRVFRRGVARVDEGTLAHSMCRMRHGSDEGVHEPDAWNRGMSVVREAPSRSEVASHASDRRKAAVHQSKGSAVRGLWGTWDSIRVCVADGDGSMGDGSPWLASGFAAGSDQQRRAIRSRQSPVGDARTESAEHTQAVAGRYARVYDILNCGPRRRFTAAGLLVHNCLVLDFSGNCLTHGPVDAVRVRDPKKRGKQEAPAKECPTCQEIVGTATRTCPRCGHAFPPPAPPQLAPAALLAPVMSTEKLPPRWVDVTRVEYALHRSKDPAKTIPTLRVDYFFHFQLVASEYICVEHVGFARDKAAAWWADHLGGPCPRTVAEALEAAPGLEVPIAIALERDGRYERVVNWRYVEAPAAPSADRNCVFCARWDDLLQTCAHWNATPPDDVRAVGCEAFQSLADEPLPF